jgi:hypothetical protein
LSFWLALPLFILSLYQRYKLGCSYTCEER